MVISKIVAIDLYSVYSFEKTDVHRLLMALNLPEFYRCRRGTKSTGMEALLILSRRLSYPNRWHDLCPLFGRTEAELSIIFNMVRQLYSFCCYSVLDSCLHLNRLWMMYMRSLGIALPHSTSFG